MEELYNNISEYCLSCFAGAKFMALGKNSLLYSSANRHGPGRKLDSQKGNFFFNASSVFWTAVLDLKH